MQKALLVTVIVPAFNAQDTIAGLIESLLRQEYPKDSLEIIIVDNNSTDKTNEIARRYPVKVLEEKIQSASSARNTGLRSAMGEIIAWTDSDCIADSAWVWEGIRQIAEGKADMVGGRVKFFGSGRLTLAQRYDSITNMRNEAYIRDNHFAVTANLFAKRAVFDKIGPFMGEVKSGADAEWTRRAVKAGFRLIYEPRAVVYHPARRLPELLRKKKRVGTGLIRIWKARGMPYLRMLYMCFRLLLPKHPKEIRKRIKDSDTTVTGAEYIGLWCVSWLCSIVKLLGVLNTLTQFPCLKSQS